MGIVDGVELRVEHLDVAPIGVAGFDLFWKGDSEHKWAKRLAQLSQGQAARAVRTKQSDISSSLAASCPNSPLMASDVPTA